MMGRKRGSNKVKLLLLVEKDLLERMKELNVNRSELMNNAMREYLQKNGLSEKNE